MNREIIAEAYRISKRIKQSVNIDTPNIVNNITEMNRQITLKKQV